MNLILENCLESELLNLEREGYAKGHEVPITGFVEAKDLKGYRFSIEGYQRKYIKMNSNDYLGLSTHPELIEAAEVAARRYGVGPGAVRFISGTQKVHVELELALANFHKRSDTIIFNSAYAAVLSTLTALTSKETAILSDELNHNCIINGIRLAKPKYKAVYKHLDLDDLAVQLESVPEECKRVLVITDGIFSMRGSYAPLKDIKACIDNYARRFPEGISLVVDDSHGVGVFGETGRGTEEYTDCQADILIGTLGKAFGVNGGYVTGSKILTKFLREKSPMYIYSNPIGPSEAAALTQSLKLVQSSEGISLLKHLKEKIEQFQIGLINLGFETFMSPHPVSPLLLRDTDRTNKFVQDLFDKGILATGIVYPVVPKGDESIRFQINANLSEVDIQEVLTILKSSVNKKVD